MAPDLQRGSGAPPPAGVIPQPGAAPPGAYPGAPQPGAGPAVQGMPPHAPQWIDPSAFAATAPPPNTGAQGAPAPGGPGGAPPQALAGTQPPVQPGEAHQPSETPQPVDATAAATLTAATPPELGEAMDPDQVPPDAPRVLAGFLVSYEDSPKGMFWPIYQGQNVIGRAGAADDLDIEIDNPTTSSIHAVIYASARPGRLKIEDSRSTNGTFLSDEKLDCDKRHELVDGAALRFGGFPVIVKVV